MKRQFEAADYGQYNAYGGAVLGGEPAYKKAMQVHQMQLGGLGQMQAMQMQMPFQSEFGGKYSAPAEEVLSETVQIPHSNAGRVIGKSGQTIADIRLKSNCDVSVNKEAANDLRDVTLTGTKMALELAKGLIGAKLVESDMSETEAVVVVPDAQAGYLIGKGGQSLKELKELSGCNIQMAKQDQSSGGERQMTLAGTPAQIALATGLIQARLAQSADEGRFYASVGGPLRGLFSRGMPITAYCGRVRGAGAPQVLGTGLGSAFGGPVVQAFTVKGVVTATSTEVIMAPQDQVGRIIGKGGQMIKHIKMKSGCDITVDKEEEKDDAGGIVRKVTLTGTNVALMVAKGYINSKLAEGAEGNDVQSAKTISVPNSRAGQLIGKGGATIKALKEASNCDIQIAKADTVPEGTHDRTMELTGTPAQIMLAEALIAAKVQQCEDRDAGTQ
mmetsp:Transcript_509/g.559  ORF Transcript_509/g.559 Transcript_509/m.559 type:complete len:444 (-) Transcript_509:79-1410(-)